MFYLVNTDAMILIQYTLYINIFVDTTKRFRHIHSKEMTITFVSNLTISVNETKCYHKPAYSSIGIRLTRPFVYSLFSLSWRVRNFVILDSQTYATSSFDFDLLHALNIIKTPLIFFSCLKIEYIHFMCQKIGHEGIFLWMLRECLT